MTHRAKQHSSKCAHEVRGNPGVSVHCCCQQQLCSQRCVCCCLPQPLDRVLRQAAAFEPGGMFVDVGDDAIEWLLL